MRGQFEQILNAVYLEKLGYGEFHEKTERESLERFLGRLDIYRRNLEDYDGGNNEIIEALKRTIDECSRGC